MPVVINGSTGISGTDGSAGTPAVQGTDTNTGVFFPAADTIAFAEGGVEAMRIDSSGNVGIGTSNPSAKLTVSDGTIRQSRTTGDNNGIVSYVGSTDNSYIRVENTTGSMDFVQGNSVGNITVNNSRDLAFNVGASERVRITTTGNFQFNSGYGSVATAYGCRAWVNFNGTGVVAIRASGNVTSITDNGTGDYTVNFTTSMPDANYGFATCAGRTAAGMISTGPVNAVPTVSSLRFQTADATPVTLTDPTFASVVIFR